MPEKEIWKLRKLYRAYLTDDIKRDMYVNWADEKLIDLVEAEEVEEEDLYKFLNQLSVLKKFIKWLVENDKIDLDACEWEKTYNNLTASRDSNYSQYERLLMALSISEQPIELLISVLK
jgi:hypothetical protein